MQSTQHYDQLLAALNHAVSGSAGGAISTFATYPLSLVITRLQVQRQLAREGKLAPEDEYRGILDAFARIHGDGGGGGLKAFYAGVQADVLKSALDSFLLFLFYEWFHAAARARSGRRTGSGRVGVLQELAVGVAAGACARALTTPIATVVTRKQAAALVDDNGGDNNDNNSSLWDILRDIRREKGLAGLWAGYSASLVLTLNPSITFFLEGFLKREALGRRGDGDGKLGPHLTFLLAAVSKSVASVVTYPFQTAKARLQVGGGGGGGASRNADEAEAGPPAATAAEEGWETEPEAEAAEATEAEAVEKQVAAKLRAVRAARAARQLARQSVFGVLARIVRAEGVAALYEGLPAELLRGFFSHGTAMLAKDAVRGLLFRLYVFVAGRVAALSRRRAERRQRTPEGLPRALPPPDSQVRARGMKSAGEERHHPREDVGPSSSSAAGPGRDGAPVPAPVSTPPLPQEDAGRRLRTEALQQKDGLLRNDSRLLLLRRRDGPGIPGTTMPWEAPGRRRDYSSGGGGGGDGTVVVFNIRDGKYRGLGGEE